MIPDNELLRQRLEAWSTDMADLRLPLWQELPPLDLYMDQVLLLLKQYLAPLLREQGEKAVTASIINNYVRMKVMPPPVKKKYARTHLAYLIIICSLKQSLSIASIRELLPAETEEDTVRQFYDDFVSLFRTVSNSMIQLTRSEAEVSLLRAGHPAAAAAIAAVLTKSLTEQLLAVEEQEQ